MLCCDAFLQVIGKGVPEDAMAGLPDRQVPCPDELVEFRYMWNSSGSKVSFIAVYCQWAGAVCERE